MALIFVNIFRTFFRIPEADIFAANKKKRKKKEKKKKEIDQKRRNLYPSDGGIQCACSGGRVGSDGEFGGQRTGQKGHVEKAGSRGNVFKVVSAGVENQPIYLRPAQ